MKKTRYSPIRTARAVRKFTFALLAIASLWTGGKAEAQIFTNPIAEMGSADPFATYHNGQYYFMRTTGDIRIQTSPNLQDVGFGPTTVVYGPGRDGFTGDIWAPEMFQMDGRWYIYACGNRSGGLAHGPQRMFCLESDGGNPLGPYHFKAQMAPELFAIDQTLLIRDSDGARFLVYCQFDPEGQCIYIAPLVNPWTVGFPRIKVSAPVLGWERHGGPVNEGPTILKRGGKTFIVYSASGTWTPDYCLGMLTNTNGDFLNPGAWAKSQNPVFSRNDLNAVWCVGHNGFVRSPDGTEDWNLYHATSSPGGDQQAQRSTRIQKVRWNRDDMPDFGVPTKAGSFVDVPSYDGSPLENGHTYVIRARHSGKCVEVGNALTNAGANVNQFQIWNPAATCQRWTAYHLGGGWWKFVNVNSGKVLDVTGGSSAPSANIQQWDWVGAWAQQWRFADAGGGYWKVINRASGQLLDVEGGPGATGNGVNVSQYYDIGGANQHWEFDEVSALVNGVTYSLLAAHSGKAAEVLGWSTANGGNIVQFMNFGSNANQRWTAWEQSHGDFGLTNLHSGKAMEVVGFNVGDGANVEQYSWGNHSFQYWRAVGVDVPGRYILFNRGSGRALDVWGGPGSTGNGANLQQWPYVGGQQWNIVP